MIREDRGVAFWTAVAAHPQVAPHVSLGGELDMGAILANQAVTPLAARNGGFLFLRLDPLGRFQELHTMFTPEGWGREVLLAAKQAFEIMFERGADLIVTHEVEGNWRSQPPRSFRFTPCGEFAPAQGLNVRLRTWAMSRSAWASSPARRRM